MGLVFCLGLLPDHVSGLQELFFWCTDKIHIHLSYGPNPVIKSYVENICIKELPLIFLFFNFISLNYTGKILTEYLFVFFFFFSILGH